ncbi:MAG: hypothetical protein QF645_02600 [Planctomycetota bacterium]|nr:hypothetical protein [Planctomycetota bacterium]
MSIRFACSECGCRLQVELSQAEKRVRCSDCERPIFAPRYSDDPDAEAASGNIEVLGTLLPSQTGRTDKKKVRKLSMGFGTVVILAAFFYLGWAYFQRTPLPALLYDLPEGDFVVYRNMKGTLFFREGKILFPGTTEIATLYRAGNGIESVSLYEGTFDPKKVEKDLLDQGYKKKGAILRKDLFSVSISPTRVLHGASWLVEEGVKVKGIRAKRFPQSLSPRQKATWQNLIPGDFVYFGKNPSQEEIRIISKISLGLLAPLSGGDTGIGVSVRVDQDHRAHCSLIVGIREETDVSHVTEMYGGMETVLESMKISSTRDVCRAAGTFSRDRLDRQQNEIRAMQALQKIAWAQEQFRNGDPYGDGRRTYWIRDLSGLYRFLSGGKAVRLIPEELAYADRSPLPTGTPGLAPAGNRVPFAGYLFSVVKANESRYVIAASPSLLGHTGEHTYVLTQDRKVWRKRGQATPPSVWPAEGWVPIPR